MNATYSAPSTARRDIQGLRALAVLAVVSAHAFGWPRGGFVGVDVFFVISGFLITGMLVRELHDHGRISLASFYARRARRILPAAVVTVAAVVATGFVVFNVVRARQTAWDGASALLLVSNWRFADLGTDYFTASDAISPLQNFWSLSVEEQYYLVWPGLLLLLALLLPAAARRGRGALVLVGSVAAAVTLGSFGWAMVQSDAQPTIAYFSTLTRAWEFAVGALLVVLVPALRRLPLSIGALLSWSGLTAIVVAFFVVDPTAPGFPGPWAALPVAATALALAGGVRAQPQHVFILTNRVSVFIGDMSYSLYLWHFPVIVFAAVLLRPSPTSIWIVLAAIATFSLASYLIVEQPLRYSPLLGGRVPTAARQTAAAESSGTTPDVAATVTPPPQPPAPAPRVISTRPADWTPGTRYYPGRIPRPVTPRIADEGVAEASVALEPSGAAAMSPEVSLARETALEFAIPAPSPAAAAQDGASGQTPTEAWRQRFGAQLMFATSGLVIVTLAGMLFFQITHVVPATAGWTQPAPAPTVVAADFAAQLQADLASATTAPSWPALDPSLDDVMSSTSSANPARDCFSPFVSPDFAACTWGSSSAPTHLYLVGDSIAMAYAPAFRKLADDSAGAISVTTVGLYGCRFTDVLVQNDGDGVMTACPQRKADIAARIIAEKPALVVMANAYALGHTADGRDLSAQDLVAAQQAEANAYGMPGRIVFVAPPPEGAPLAVCYAPSTSPSACSTTVSSTWHDMQTAAVQDAAATGDHVIDSLPFSCWQEVCPAFAGSLPIRYDQTHLTVAYSEHIAPYLRGALAATGLIP